MTSKLNNEGLAARFIRTAKPSSEQDSIPYAVFIQF